MNRIELEALVISTLREISLAGSPREINLSLPLGEQGLGLDSLALVKFFTALEGRLDVEIPESIWMERERLNLRGIIDTILPMVLTHQPAVPQARPASAVRPGGGGRIGKIIGDHGVAGGGLSRILKYIGRFLMRHIYERTVFYILSFDFRRQSVPAPALPPDVSLSVAGDDDLTAATELWPKKKRLRKLATFRERVSKGFIAYVAKVAGTVVAIDWVTETTDDEPNTGLSIRPQAGSCYGLDLYEHPEYHGQGMGLATLIYCLQQSKERGCARQYTIVEASNKKMLLTCIQLIGFTKVGRIETTRIFGRPSSRWIINGISGEGRVLPL